MKKLLISAAIVLSTVLTFGQQASEPKCKAVTKTTKQPCKNDAKENGFCGAHDPNRPKCGFLKKDGEACKMNVKKIGDKCYHHNGK